MPSMIHGETVFVKLRGEPELDEYGNEVFGEPDAPPIDADELDARGLSEALEGWSDLSPRAWTVLRSVIQGEGLTVGNVLVGPGQSHDAREGGRPYGTYNTVTFYFPKSFDEDVRGALIACRGAVYEVMGDPTRYTDALVPGDWNLVVPAVRRDGR